MTCDYEFENIPSRSHGVSAITRLSKLAAAAAIFGLSPFVLGAQTAHAQQQLWSSQYVNWRLSNPSVTEIWNVDQEVWIPRTAAASYWPLVWDWKSPESGGYLGLQEQGDGQQTVRFSIWDASAAAGTDCRTFGGEGIGYTCTLPVTIDTQKFYRYRLYRLDGAPDGQWWGGWLIEADASGTVIEHYIGMIKAPVEAQSVDPDHIENFVEYFGDPVSRCRDVPLSITALTPPAVNYSGDAASGYESYTAFNVSEKAEGNHCVDGNQADGAIITAEPFDFGFATGVVMYMGGPGNQRQRLIAPPVPVR